MGLDNDDIKQLIAILQKGLVDSNDELDSIPTNKTNKKSKFKNLFEDMTEASMHKDDIEIDRKLKKFPPTRRSRNYNPISVKCRSCGKQEEVSPALIESVDRYKCNKCSTSAG